MTAVNILGIEVDCVDVAGLLDRVGEWVEQAQPRLIAYVNAHCLNLAYENGDYRAVLDAADLVYSDGIGAVWAGRILAGCRLEKITGRDWINDFEGRAVAHGWRVYILAGKPGVAARAASLMRQRSPGLEVVGVSDGFFAEKSEAEVLREIATTRPHVVFVGMGTPTQEIWLASHRQDIHAPVCWAVGALFDYVAGIEPPVPAWLNVLALEWLWRFCMDPLGKWRRYLVGTPLFILRVCQQKFGMR